MALDTLQNTHGIKREDLFIQTKFTSLSGQDPARIPYDKNATLQEQVYIQDTEAQKLKRK